MTQSVDKVVPFQVPEFVRSNYGKFIDFLRAYYEFLKQYDLEITNFRDPDLTADNLVIFLKQEFANRFPEALVDDRKLIKTIREIYKSKGTVNAIKLLFRLFYNESIKITIPNKFILRASDGIWEQFSFITVQQTFIKPGYVLDLNSNSTFIFENSNGTFNVNIEKIEQIDSNVFRFYYRSFNQLFFDEQNQVIDYYGENNELLFRGLLLKQPVSLDIKESGKFWKKGQVFFLMGTKKDTICKVTNVGPNGELISTDIFSYGYDHSENQIFLISPLGPKPPQSSYSITKNIIGYNPFTEEIIYDYSIDIDDKLNLEEECIIARYYENGNPYAIENYFLEDYALNETQILSTRITSGDTAFIFDGDYSIEEWYESLTSLTLKYGYISKLPGKFLADKGFISSPVSRLQDNYFYQLFSYVIESTKNINEYRKLLSEVHPAGMKFFAELAKTAIITFGDLHISRTISRARIYIDDKTDGVEDIYYLQFVKQHFEEIATQESFFRKTINKNIVETQVISDGTATSFSAIFYDSEDYFAENYNLTDIIITIS